MTPPPPLPSRVDTDRHSRVEVLRAVYSLVVITQSTMRRAMMVMCIAALTLVVLESHRQTQAVERLVRER